MGVVSGGYVQLPIPGYGIIDADKTTGDGWLVGAHTVNGAEATVIAYASCSPGISYVTSP